VSGVLAIVLMSGTPGLLLGVSLIASGLSLAYLTSR
jgi:hypothetical protein